MKRIQIGTWKALSVILFLLQATGCEALERNSIPSAKEVKKPNFVWLVSEDNSKNYLKLYDPNGASMPNIEALADNGLVFENALSNAPVCSTARTTLALGAYPTKLAMSYHRPYKRVKLPETLTTINEYLRLAGYYTTNDHKEDYNFVEPTKHWFKSEQGASWKERQPGQPFFHMQSWNTTHEHKLHFPKSDIENRPTLHDPNTVNLAPIYPDTKLFRYTHARYLDQHKKVDAEIGEVIKQLEEEGILEDTFVFYFGDHGGVLPGSKGYAYERGLNVPLVVRIPKNFKHLLHKDLHGEQQTRIEGFVNFIDFAPTLLHLAGLPPVDLHDGVPFLSKEASIERLSKRDTHFAFADRFDEKYDMVRTLRIGKYKYIRNYLPFNPDSLNAAYRYKQAAYREWREMYKQGLLTPVQASFFQSKPVEALYNIEKDFYETINLATDRKYDDILVSMRKELQSKLDTLPDLGFYPEYHLTSNAIDNALAFGQENKAEIAELRKIADLSLRPFHEVKTSLKNTMTSDNEWHRYWALNAVLSFGSEAIELLPLVETTYKYDTNTLNQARAVQFMTLHSNFNPKQALEKIVNDTKDTAKVLSILNIATQLYEATDVKFNFSFRNNWNKPGNEVTEPMENWRMQTIHNWFKDRLTYINL